ncbi:MAG: hypothetical protein ACE5EG_06865 [Thermoanaerobaculia bacterium]
MSADYRVKGSSIRSKFEFVRDRFGEAAARALKERFRQRGILPVLDSKMYPFEDYDVVLRAIAEEFFDGDLSRLAEVGAYSAQQVLTGVYRAFAAGKDFPGFLSRAAVLHERFYSHGGMDVDLEEDGKSCRIVLEGAPTYSESDLYIAGGFYAGAADLLGIKSLDWDLSWDSSGARFQLRWV